MQKKFLLTYLFIFLTLLIIMSISRPIGESLRGNTVAFLAPLWEKVLTLKYFVNHPTQPSPFTFLSPEDECQKFQTHNQLLLTEIAYLQQLLNDKTHLSSQIASIATWAPDEALLLANDYSKAVNRSIKQLKWNLQSVAARVIFRSFDTWNSTLWINVGENSNSYDITPVIAKNSPVVIGKAVVGLIDYVGKNHSRVRLITDNNLTPAVRASRGGEQESLMHQYLEGLTDQMNQKKHLPLSPDSQEQLVQLLQELKKNLRPYKKSWYLAKGELQGSSSLTRRSLEPLLKGTGFNYDFSDEEGEGRDLRTGKPLKNNQEQGISILKVHDVLVTTGMDGIFPSGFQIATVTKVGLLKEGDYFYEIEAKPIAGPLEELSLVFVLPPMTEEPIQPQELKYK